jgi:hypothetical protein
MGGDILKAQVLLGVPGAIAGKCTVRCPDRLS